MIGETHPTQRQKDVVCVPISSVQQQERYARSSECLPCHRYVLRSIRDLPGPRKKKDSSLVGGTRAPCQGTSCSAVSKADRHLTEIFLGETINKSGVSHDRVNLAVGGAAVEPGCTKENTT